MPLSPTAASTAFQGDRRIASGPLGEVALSVKRQDAAADAIVLVFDDATGAVVDLDLRGSDAEIVARLAERFGPIQSSERVAEGQSATETSDAGARGRGRPKLGVVAREVTLLPRQWEWLAAQPGGASQALRRLVDTARRTHGDEGGRRARHEAAYRFLSTMAGNRPGFEEASRALFADNRDKLIHEMADWPVDVRQHALKLAGFARD